jgi:hypothetical protein
MSVKDSKSLRRAIEIFNSSPRYSSSKKGNHDALSDFFNFKGDVNKSIAKVRIEGNAFCIYSSDHQYLLDIVKVHLSEHIDSLTRVFLVESLSHLHILDQGNIIVKKTKPHPYRVKLNYGFFKDFASRASLATYIEQLGDEVKISKNLLEELRLNNKYFRGGHLYVKDLNVANMLKFISPSIIGSTHQMIQG